MSAPEAGAAVFDPFEDGFVASPYAQYARLRDGDPVHHSKLLHGWVITRFDDVGRLLRDPSVSSDIRNATPNPLTINELARLAEQERASRTVVLMDDPDHGRIRRLLTNPFRPREVALLAERITERIGRAFDQLREQYGDGRVELDLISEFAYPQPVEIFSEILGVPDEDHPQFRYWAQCVARTVDPILSEAEREVCLKGLDDMYAYLEVVAEEKRAAPTGDLLSDLVHADDEGARLTHEELMAQLVTLYMAGHEPVASLLGSGTLALLRAPDQLERLRSDPSVLRNGVSELLRYDGPNQFVRRILTQPTLVGETELPAGEVIYASPASANRDPRRWGDTAEQVQVDRPDAGQHLQFGAGVHACLGSHLARLQAEIAFAAIFERLDDLELAGEPEWGNRMFIRGLNSLPVACRINAGTS